MNPPRPLSPNYKWEALALLWFAFFFNQADRQIFGVVLPLIRADLHLTDAELGFIASALGWTLAITVPLAGWVSDRYPKNWIITASLCFWSAATLFTGVSSTLVQFILLRSVATGGGEAFYAPAANALISDLHRETRARAMAIHQTALYVGVVASGGVAGWIGQQWGWRPAFYVFGAGGIVLAVVFAWRLRRPEAPSAAKEEAPGAPRSIVRVFLGKPTAVLLTIAFTAVVFVNVGYLAWMPTFLHERFGLSLAAAGFSSMFYHHASALAGVLLGGWLSDRAVQSDPNARLKLQCLGLALGAPFLLFMGTGSTPFAVLGGSAGFGFFRGIFEANLYAVLFDVIAPTLRASASGFMIMFAFLTGACSPYLLGVLKPTLGLAHGLASLGVVYLLGALAIALAWRVFAARDRLSSSSIV
ncbi:MAG: MFS transporter [Verrucomicrobia bacterium]|nr:MFS transporter [Verrucomicrobiota bacterium]